MKLFIDKQPRLWKSGKRMFFLFPFSVLFMCITLTSSDYYWIDQNHELNEHWLPLIRGKYTLERCLLFFLLLKPVQATYWGPIHCQPLRSVPFFLLFYFFYPKESVCWGLSHAWIKVSDTVLSTEVQNGSVRVWRQWVIKEPDLADFTSIKRN